MPVILQFCVLRVFLCFLVCFLNVSTISLTMSNDQSPRTPTPQVTLISDNVSIPPFSGTNSESVQAFVRRVDDECTRRSAHFDTEKLAILKSRICHDPSSLAGKLIKTDKFLSFSTYDELTTALISHFSGHSKLGATHSFLKIAQTLTNIARSTHDVYKAENIASSLSAELTDQMKSSQGIDTDGNISSTDFKRLMSYFLFLVQVDSPTFTVASDIIFSKEDFLYDLCKKISEKSPPVPQPVSLVQSPHSLAKTPFSQYRSSSPQNPSPPSNTHSSRSHYRSHSRHRSSSRDSRKVTCYRCGLKDHVSADCRVMLDERGYHKLNRDAFCSLHNRRGHSLEECRLNQQQMQSFSSQSSGNDSRQSLEPPR